MSINKFGAKTQIKVSYGEVEKKEDDEQRCPICNSRIDEFGYCGCGGKLGVS